MPNVAHSPELPWVAEAKRMIGTHEIKGPMHNAVITGWYKYLPRIWWKPNDETAWCGLFIGYCLAITKRYVISAWYRASAYSKIGVELTTPAYGCVGVMTRSGGGHVCFILGETYDGRLVVIGGNQNDQVSIQAYPKSRFSGFYWPSREGGVPSLPYPYRHDLPLYSNSLKASTSEA